jgi:hypothetical protein
MSEPNLAAQTSRLPKGVDCRVWERHSCDLETSCQPIADRANREHVWQAQIHDISLSGIGIILDRRFEKGAGLAIQIPETDHSSGEILLAKVVHTTALPEKKWLLGCSFAIAISHDQIRRLVDLGQTPEPPLKAECEKERRDGQVVVSDVLWEGPVNGRRLIERFQLKGTWPLTPGSTIRLWSGQNPGAKVRIRVNGCYKRDGRWVVNYTFLDNPNPELLKKLGYKT